MVVGVGVGVARGSGVEDLALIDTGDVIILFSLGAVLDPINPNTKNATKRKRTCQALKLDFFIL